MSVSTACLAMWNFLNGVWHLAVRTAEVCDAPRACTICEFEFVPEWIAGVGNLALLDVRLIQGGCIERPMHGVAPAPGLNTVRRGNLVAG